VRVFTDDARFLLKALPDHSVERCYILFADPWPKKRHNKRRIVNAETLSDLARALTQNGKLYLATDDPGLAEWYGEVVTAHPAFTLHPAIGDDPQIRPADWPATRYEEKALAKGKAPFYYRLTLNKMIGAEVAKGAFERVSLSNGL
jgi:tRNA (guanine-N7-)-methyltransferase